MKKWLNSPVDMRTGVAIMALIYTAFLIFISLLK